MCPTRLRPKNELVPHVLPQCIPARSPCVYAEEKEPTVFASVIFHPGVDVLSCAFSFRFIGSTVYVLFGCRMILSG